LNGGSAKMSAQMTVTSALKQRMANSGTAGRIALLALLLAAVSVLVLPAAYAWGGFNGLIAAAVAAAVVSFASALGMAMGQLSHGPSQAFTNLLISMLVRMAIPLAACLLVLLTSSRLAEAGFVFYVLGYYLAALPIDTAFAVLGQSNPKVANSA
jgi:hypothetical protein